MTMLIKGGLIHTMTGQGSFVGDVLVRDGRIVAVGPEIEPPHKDSTCLLDAKGLTILPGLIDAHIHDGPENGETLLRSAHSSGVTSGLLWPEEERRCLLLTSSGGESSAIHIIDPDEYTDAQLHDRFLALAAEGCRIACEIHSVQECRRVLMVVHSTRVRAILVHLTGCEEMLEAVALSGCPVVVGVNHSRISSPWTMACNLSALNVPVSLTCNHPDAKLRHLPLCAALCVREGIARESAMHMVTTAPASLLGLSDAGVIASGARADLAIYDGDPLLLASSHVMTIAGGKIRH